MQIFITGGTGFVGKHLSEYLLSKGHSVIVTGSRPEFKGIENQNFRYIAANTTQPGLWQEAVKESDAVINLAGRNIFHYWTEKYKKQIRDSRIQTTRYIADALPNDKPVTLCSTSAVGYYGDRDDDPLTEDEPNGNDFLAQVCWDWEQEANRAQEKGHRVVTMRFGIVLGKNGGAMEKMLPAFRMGVGGPMGDGSQWFPWIHLNDLLTAIEFSLEHKIEGPVNFCAPNPTRNRDFVKKLGTILNRPTFMPAPAFIIRLLLRELGDTLLSSQKAVPEKLMQSGYKFKFPEIQNALLDIVAGS